MREWGPSYFRSLDRENRLYGLRQHWSSNVRERVELLRELQAEHGELQAKFKEEVAALEAKLYQPLFTKRYEIVNGISEFESDEAASVEEKGVPGFWLAAMKNNRDLFKVITRRDGECLKFLKDIKWSLIYDPKGFKLEFFFAPNPYFKKSVLTKMYLMIDEDEPKETIGTEIDWYPGKLLTQKVLKKKKKKKKAKSEKNPIAETKPCRSFFHFFNPIQVPGEETDEDEFDVDDFNMADFYDAIEYLDYDYKIGSIIGEKIIPNAVSWFTREVDEAFCDDLEIDYEEEDDDEDEDEMERQRKSHMLLGRKMDWKKKEAFQV